VITRDAWYNFSRPMPRSLARPIIAVVSIAATAMLVSAQGKLSKRDSDVMKQKVAAIVAYSPPASKQLRRTTITENEVNAYLQYEIGDALPAGVVEPSVTASGPGRVSGRAVVDLDAVRKAAKSGGLLDPRSYLAGSLPVTAVGMLRTGNGIGRFELESATVGGVPIPKWLLQEIVSYYSKSPDDPDGISLDDPFELPAHIREIQVQVGHAIVVQ
jgi:hypothetical protein